MESPHMDEYLDALSTWMQEWREEEDAWIIPQFLKRHSIGWSTLEHLINQSPLLKNEFETTLAALADKWMTLAMKSKTWPKHMQQAFARYLSIYDGHLLHMETEAKKSIAREETNTVMNYVVEDYGKEVLKGLYEELYTQNSKKCYKMDE